MLNVACLFAAILAGCLQNDSIRIDGCFSDWGLNVPRVVDSDGSDGVPTELDLLDVRHDEEYVMLLLDVGRPVNLQKLTGTIEIAVDVDGKSQTGKVEHDLDGADLLIELTPYDSDDSRPTHGVAVRTFHAMLSDNADTTRRSGYDVGLHFAPTYASRWFELAIRRRLDPDVFAASFSQTETMLRAVYRDSEGEVQLQSPTYRHELSDDEHAAPPDADIAIAARRGDVRVMTWNCNDGAMFDRPEPFSRMLRAVAPDVLLWQELPEEVDADALRRWLNTALTDVNGASWHAVVGAGGGSRRCAVAARTPLIEPEAMRNIDHPVRDEHTVSVAAAIAEFNTHRLLLTSVHLKCCGRAGSFEDFQRRRELSAIKRGVHRAYSEHDIDATIISGDFNLVGSGHHLWSFATGLDVDGRHLRIAEPLQPDGRFNSTWSDRTMTYVPGRLDYLMHSRQLNSVNAVVFNTEDLDPARADWLGVRPDDAALASDHFPVFVDLRTNAEDTSP